MTVPSVPRSLRDRYKIERVVGEGGSATVFAAHDPKMGRRVALKLYNTPLTPKRESDRPSPNEAQLGGKVAHPNVVPIYDTGSADGRLYLVMQFLSGGSLRDQMERHTEPYAPSAALPLALVMTEALQAVHDARILHLDIKPENILFDGESRPYLTDFGIAKLLGEDGVVQQTNAVGTKHYAAPEQQYHGQLSTRADIFSMGVVLFEMLTGYVPLGPAPAESSRSHSPPFHAYDPLTASTRLTALLTRALQAEPSRRYASAADFCAAIRDVSGRADETTDRLDAQRQQRDGNVPHVVRFTLPNARLTPLEASDARPHSARALRDDLVPIPPRSEVNHALYSHHDLEIGRDSLLTQPVFARGVIRVGRGVIARQDLISLSAIEIADGAQLKNVIAPRIMLRAAARVVGSIFCKELVPAGGAALPHLHAGTEIGGCLLLESDFLQLAAAEAAGRPLVTPAKASPDRPLVRVAPDCQMIAIMGDADVTLAPQQRAINLIRVSGDVVVERDNRLQRVEGRNIHLKAGCEVEEVYARGRLVIDEDCIVGFIHAANVLRLGPRVRVGAPLLMVEGGAIHADETAHWQRFDGQPIGVGDFFHQHHAEGSRGTLTTPLLDHSLHDLYEAIAPEAFADLALQRQEAPLPDVPDAPPTPPAPQADPPSTVIPHKTRLWTRRRLPGRSSDG